VNGKSLHVIIHGLRRSGTTILWETLRSAAHLRCYDEPFHPKLAAGARANHKGTWTEFASLLTNHSLKPVPILPEDELLSESSPEQIGWLGALCNTAHPCVIDIVRGWNRAPGLHGACGPVLSVHLLRDPATWVAAHLLPTGAMTVRRRVAQVYRQTTFFSRRGFYDNYQYQTIIETALAQEHPVFGHVVLSCTALRREPAYIKLLAFWWGANQVLAQRLRASNSPSLTVTLPAFSRQPQIEIDRIARAAGWDALKVSTDAVRVGDRTFGETAPHWRRAARRLGLPEALFGEPMQRHAALIDSFGQRGPA
jgi:hypothetical protein